VVAGQEQAGQQRRAPALSHSRARRKQAMTNPVARRRNLLRGYSRRRSRTPAPRPRTG
jgi:hypothetical protein